MPIRKIVWSLLAGVSILAAGCGSSTVYGPPPEYGPPADSFVDPDADAADSHEADALSEDLDVEEEEGPPATDYGPPRP